METIRRGKLQITYGIDHWMKTVKVYLAKDWDCQDNWHFQDYWYLTVRIWRFYLRIRLDKKYYTFGEMLKQNL